MILYKVMTAPVLFYISEAWNSTRQEENRISTSSIRLLSSVKRAKFYCRIQEDMEINSIVK